MRFFLSLFYNNRLWYVCTVFVVSILLVCPIWSQEPDAQLDRREDLLIMDSGEKIAGNFVTSDRSSILFRAENDTPRSYPRSEVSLVVLGVKKISFWQGITPGWPQFIREQNVKGYFFVGGTIFSLTAVAVGFLQFLSAQAELLSPSRKSQDQIEALQNQQKLGSALAGLGGASGLFIYTWHIMDWQWWGDNYNLFLSKSDVQDENGDQMFVYQNAFSSDFASSFYKNKDTLISYSYGTNLSYGDSDVLYRLEAKFLF